MSLEVFEKTRKVLSIDTGRYKSVPGFAWFKYKQTVTKIKTNKTELLVIKTKRGNNGIRPLRWISLEVFEKTRKVVSIDTGRL